MKIIFRCNQFASSYLAVPFTLFLGSFDHCAVFAQSMTQIPTEGIEVNKAEAASRKISHFGRYVCSTIPRPRYRASGLSFGLEPEFGKGYVEKVTAWGGAGELTIAGMADMPQRLFGGQSKHFAVFQFDLGGKWITSWESAKHSLTEWPRFKIQGGYHFATPEFGGGFRIFTIGVNNTSEAAKKLIVSGFAAPFAMPLFDYAAILKIDIQLSRFRVAESQETDDNPFAKTTWNLFYGAMKLQHRSGLEGSISVYRHFQGAFLVDGPDEAQNEASAPLLSDLEYSLGFWMLDSVKLFVKGSADFKKTSLGVQFIYRTHLPFEAHFSKKRFKDFMSPIALTADPVAIQVKYPSEPALPPASLQTVETQARSANEMHTSE